MCQIFWTSDRRSSSLVLNISNCDHRCSLLCSFLSLNLNVPSEIWEDQVLGVGSEELCGGLRLGPQTLPQIHGLQGKWTLSCNYYYFFLLIFLSCCASCVYQRKVLLKSTLLTFTLKDYVRLLTLFSDLHSSVFRWSGAPAPAGWSDCGGGPKVKGHLWLVQWLSRCRCGLWGGVRHLPADSCEITATQLNVHVCFAC